MKKFTHICDSCASKKEAFLILKESLWALVMQKIIDHDFWEVIKDELFALEPEDCNCWKEYADEGMKEEY